MAGPLVHERLRCTSTTGAADAQFLLIARLTELILERSTCVDTLEHCYPPSLGHSCHFAILAPRLSIPLQLISFLACIESRVSLQFHLFVTLTFRLHFMQTGASTAQARVWSIVSIGVGAKG